MSDSLQYDREHENQEEHIRYDGVLEKGFGLSPATVMRDPNISIEAKGLYAYFSSFAGSGSGSVAFPSRDLICKELGIGKNRYYTHRRQLEEAGYIRTETGVIGNTVPPVRTPIIVICNEVPVNQDGPQDNGPQDKNGELYIDKARVAYPNYAFVQPTPKEEISEALEASQDVQKTPETLEDIAQEPSETSYETTVAEPLVVPVVHEADAMEMVDPYVTFEELFGAPEEAIKDGFASVFGEVGIGKPMSVKKAVVEQSQEASKAVATPVAFTTEVVEEPGEDSKEAYQSFQQTPGQTQSPYFRDNGDVEKSGSQQTPGQSQSPYFEDVRKTNPVIEHNTIPKSYPTPQPSNQEDFQVYPQVVVDPKSEPVQPAVQPAVAPVPIEQTSPAPSDGWTDGLDSDELKAAFKALCDSSVNRNLLTKQNDLDETAKAYVALVDAGYGVSEIAAAWDATQADAASMNRPAAYHPQLAKWLKSTAAGGAKDAIERARAASKGSATNERNTKASLLAMKDPAFKALLDDFDALKAAAQDNPTPELRAAINDAMNKISEYFTAHENEVM